MCFGIALFIPFALASCNEAGDSKATPLVPGSRPTLTWQLSFQRSGGFAGLSQHVTVESTGRAVFVNVRTQRRSETELEETDLVALRNLLDSSNFFSQSSPQTRRCFDCFNYKLTLEEGGRRHTVEANDLSLAPQLKPLVQWLSNLLEQGLLSTR